MAKIVDYPALTTPATTDVLVIEDLAAGSTKKVTRDSLLNYGSSITSTGLAAGSVTNTKLSTSAIKLGKTSVTSIGGITSTAAFQQVTGLAVTVTIPTGGRSVKITGYLPNVADSVTGRTVVLAVYDGAVPGGTQLGAQSKYINSASDGTGMTVIAEHTPSSGSHTYNLGITDQATGSLTFNGAGSAALSSTNPAWILVEVI